MAKTTALARSSVIRRLAYDERAYGDINRHVSKACNEAFREANKVAFVQTSFGSRLLLERRCGPRSERGSAVGEDPMEEEDDDEQDAKNGAGAAASGAW